MTWIIRCTTLLLAGLALTLPALAQETRHYACTNMMGGNAFYLELTGDRYSVAADPGALRQFSGEGGLDLESSIISIVVTSGPLLDDLQADSIIPLSSGQLMVSGEQGINTCTKRKS